MAIAAVALTIFGMRLAVLRCHDCDKSGWWSMLLWLPTVNFIVTVVLSCAPGTDGDNEYGEQPPPSSWWAFAASPSGGWGWAATRRSQAEAARDALLDCETRRPTYTAPCALVNMNGQWAPGQ